VIDIFQFDHALNEFINIGKGTVSDDASIIVSDPGFGVTRAGWGGCGQPQPPTTCTTSCNDGKKCTDDNLDTNTCSCSNPIKPPTGTACGPNTTVATNAPTKPNPGSAASRKAWGTTKPEFPGISIMTDICLDSNKYKVRVSNITVPFLMDFNFGAVTNCDSVVPKRANYCQLLTDLHARGTNYGFCISQSCVQAHENRHKTHRLQQWNSLGVEAKLEAIMQASSDQVCAIADANSHLAGQINKVINDAKTQFQNLFGTTGGVSETLALVAEDACYAPRRTIICNQAKAAGTDGDPRSWMTTNPCGEC